ENNSVAANASQLPAKTKKSVRIESPTSSPPHPAFHDADDALLQRVNRGKHVGSPPPTSSAGLSDSFEGLSLDEPLNNTTDHGDDGQPAHTLTGNTRTTPDMAESASTQSCSGVPANPFSKTLATIESREKGTAEQREYLSDRGSMERAGSGTTRQSLDVEGFKRLLMTGISNPPSSGTPSSQAASAPNPIGASVFESSSSTDTSSVSRQSIFEPIQEPLSETPRTSYELAASDDDERLRLVGENRKSEKKKPPPPKHRHGKLVTSRTPQTVSFSDFSPFVVSQASQLTPSPISRNRTNSDLNKPLPPPPILSPPAHIVSQDKSQENPPLQTTASESSSQSDAPVAQKKTPPPVPVARRQSQLRSSTTGNRSRSNSSLTMSSQHSTEFLLLSPGLATEPTSHHQTQKPPPPPPPPPSRRHVAPVAGIQTSSANSSTTELPSTASARTTVSSPTPPSRRPTVSSPPASPAPGLTRTSSRSSNRNPRSVSNESSGMPPPPPPPRRRQSGRTSMDKERPLRPSNTSPTESRRTSSENKRSSFDGKRRTSVASESSLRYEYALASENEQTLYLLKGDIAEEPRTLEPSTSSKNNASDILDDMEKFQREIDELRERYKTS
ncbi:hypothetical protein K469DRAFT_612083, partial [Zopfia rhizophila CBS 207.26]